MRRDEINPESKNFNDIFSSNKYFLIPKFQRPFAWDKEDAEIFINDIKDYIFDDSVSTDYFLGSIVVSKNDDNTYEVIDGQQRLTVASLFIFAIYLLYSRINPYDAQEIYKYLRIGRFGSEKKNILTLSRNNNDFYTELIVNDRTYLQSIDTTGISDSNKKIVTILNWFLEKLETSAHSDSALEKQRLEKIFNRFIEKIFLIQIPVSSHGDGSKIFEVLNNRGQDLTKADLIRNHIFTVAETQGFLVQVENKWNKLEDNIGIDNLEQFFRYLSFSYSKKDDIFDRVEEKITSSSSQTFIDEALNYSEVYKIFLNYGLSQDDTEAKLLEEINILSVSQCYSLLLATHREFGYETYKDILQFIINFTFIYSTICGENPNKIEKIYSQLSYELLNGYEHEGERLSHTIDTIKSRMMESLPSITIFEQRFREKPFKTNRIPRYLLGKIEHYISTGEKLINPNEVHLEHIMPLNIDIWKRENPIYSDLHKKYIYSLGNMVLLSKKLNTSIKNKTLSEKKPKYLESELNIVRRIDFSSIALWDEDSINNNLNRYLELSLEIWGSIFSGSST